MPTTRCWTSARRLVTVSRAGQRPSLQTGGRATISTGWLRAHALLALQAALSTVLIIGAALFTRSVVNLYRADLGLTENADVLDQVGQRLLLRELRPAFMDFVYHPMARDPNSAGRFADVINRAKDELVTPAEFAAFAQGRREAFDMSHDGGFETVIAELRERDALGRLWQVNSVRRELIKSGRDAADKIASREARRDVSGTGEALWWNQLSKEQERMAKGIEQK